MAEIYRPSGVLAWLSRRVSEISGRDLSSGQPLHESNYRFPLPEQPDASFDGTFYVDGRVLRMLQKSHGNQRRRWEVGAVVEVGFHVSIPADDAQGDAPTLLGVNKRALDDCQTILDALEDSLGYRVGETGIQMVRSAGEATRVEQGERKEIWAIPVTIEFETAWIGTPPGVQP